MRKQAKILLIDDDPDFVEATSTLLENFYQVAVAFDGQEGLKKAQEERPDLIILDVIMPVLDGLEVHKRLKRDPHLANVPVIMLTCLSHEPDEAMEAEDYIDKMELSIMELPERVHRLLRS
ncbi:MAG: response regulator [Chloroflexota bacterium]|nr:response regulator [Chloroflexota bacterium]